MPTKRIFFSGLKGGVGTSSIVANISCALRHENQNAIAIDLDKKNELRLHFGLDWQSKAGWTNSFADKKEKWTDHFFQDSDGVKFLPFGNFPKMESKIPNIIKESHKLNLQNNDSWLLFDCPSHIDKNDLELENNDVLIEVINCDPTCHSLIHLAREDEATTQKKYEHYYLINRFNSNSEIEVEIYQLWRDCEPKLAPFFIHSDEVVKEALAFKNVAFNCAPYSVVIDDYKTLICWLMSKFND
jgi:cellulose synthase operon protein YhjQ